MHKNKATLLIYVPFRVIIAKNKYGDSSGQGEIPDRRYSPRARRR